jgi:hypothetical protein
MTQNADIEQRLTTIEKWHEQDYATMRARLDRHGRVLFGDEQDRRASGLVEDVRAIEKGQRRIERLVTISIVTNVFQLLFILVLFFIVFRLLVAS